MGALLEKPITDKETEQDGRGDIRYAVSGMQGWRPEMEDAHVAALDFEKMEGFCVFSVFDGHGGGFTSAYAKENVLKILSRQEHFQMYVKLPAQSLRDHPV